MKRTLLVLMMCAAVLLAPFTAFAENELCVYDLSYTVGENEIHSVSEAVGNTVTVNSTFMPKKGIKMSDVTMITAVYEGNRLMCIGYNPYTVTPQKSGAYQNYDIIQCKSYSVSVPENADSVKTFYWSSPAQKPVCKALASTALSSDNTVKSASVEISGKTYTADIDNWYNTINFNIDRAYATSTSKKPALTKITDDASYAEALQTFSPVFVTDAEIISGGGVQNAEEPYFVTLKAANGEERTYTLTVKDTTTLFDVSFNEAGAISANAGGLLPRVSDTSVTGKITEATSSEGVVLPSDGPDSNSGAKDTLHFNGANQKYYINVVKPTGLNETNGIINIGDGMPSELPKEITMEYKMYLDIKDDSKGEIRFSSPFFIGLHDEGSSYKQFICITKNSGIYFKRHNLNNASFDIAKQSEELYSFPDKAWVDVKMIFSQEQNALNGEKYDRKYSLYINGRHVATDILYYTELESSLSKYNMFKQTSMVMNFKDQFWFSGVSGASYDLYFKNMKMSYSK